MTAKEKNILKKALWLIKNNSKWFDVTAALRIEKEIEEIIGEYSREELNKEFDKEMLKQLSNEDLAKLFCF
jgi:hypothetical protein